MRLDQKEIQSLILATENILGEIPFQVYLFGSRLHDEKRGGDINLLLKVS